MRNVEKEHKHKTNRLCAANLYLWSLHAYMLSKLKKIKIRIFRSGLWIKQIMFLYDHQWYAWLMILNLSGRGNNKKTIVYIFIIVPQIKNCSNKKNNCEIKQNEKI